jgi:hypothetical protein
LITDSKAAGLRPLKSFQIAADLSYGQQKCLQISAGLLYRRKKGCKSAGRLKSLQYDGW